MAHFKHDLNTSAATLKLYTEHICCQFDLGDIICIYVEVMGPADHEMQWL